MTLTPQNRFFNGTPEKEHTVFMFLSQPIQVLYQNGSPWFIAKDVCSILGIKQPTRTLENFPEDEKGVSITHTLGGNQQVLCVNEVGLYRLIFQSRKNQAEQFKTWVCKEVLPQIRTTGSYHTKPRPQEPALAHAFKTEKPIDSVLESGRRLITLKESVRHGEFLTRLYTLGVSASSAHNYMKIYTVFAHYRTRLTRLSMTKLLMLCQCSFTDIQALFQNKTVHGISLSDIETMNTRSLKGFITSYTQTKQIPQQKYLAFTGTGYSACTADTKGFPVQSFDASSVGGGILPPHRAFILHRFISLETRI